MKITFTNLSLTKSARFSNLKPSGFRFEEEGCTLKIISTANVNVYSGNGTIEDAIGTIAGAINEAPEVEKSRLLLELEIIIEYFERNEEMTDFLEKILVKVGEKDDWD